MVIQQPTPREKVIPETERNEVRIMIPKEEIDAHIKIKSSLSIGNPSPNNSLMNSIQ